MITDLHLQREDKRIFGLLYTPDIKTDRYPLIIMSHGFRMSHEKVAIQAEKACAAGYAVYIFDFCGGSSKSKSDGLVREMSVLTEADDLKTIVSCLKNHPQINKEKIFLMGESQGGFVSAYVATEISDIIAGLVLFSPAFVLQADAWKRFETEKLDHSKTYDIRGEEVGAVYFSDAMSFDIYEVIGKYPKPVLIVHGGADPLVPVAYSEKAIATFKNAKLEILPNAGHSFYKEDAQKASQLMLAFLDELIKK